MSLVVVEQTFHRRATEHTERINFAQYVIVVTIENIPCTPYLVCFLPPLLPSPLSVVPATNSLPFFLNCEHYVHGREVIMDEGPVPEGWTTPKAT